MNQNINQEDCREYCEILGVLPGASAGTVQQSFRDLIKKYHPDSASTESDKKRAQLLIEAYSALKNGVPKNKAPQRTRQKANTSSEDNGVFSAERMFRSVFTDAPPHSKIRSFFKNIDFATNVYPENESDTVWEYTPQDSFGKSFRESFGESKDFGEESENTIHQAGEENYLRAEVLLSETVKSFDSHEDRFKKRWAREFIGDLVQIQVLYRDICRLSPAFTYNALRRVRQISGLISEIRKSC